MPEKNIKQIVRILGADLDGSKPLYSALNKIYGINFMSSNAVCNTAGINKTKKIGELNSNEIEKISSIIKNPSKFNIPVWLFNRRHDLETNQDKHILGSDLKFQKEQDIKYARKIKSYRGMRHSFGLPVRGQRTRSNFRHGKTVGVKKKGLKIQKSEGKGKKQETKGKK